MASEVYLHQPGDEVVINDDSIAVGMKLANDETVIAMIEERAFGVVEKRRQTVEVFTDRPCGAEAFAPPPKYMPFNTKPHVLQSAEGVNGCTHCFRHITAMPTHEDLREGSAYTEREELWKEAFGARYLADNSAK